jgi:hypothetical protein
MEPKELVGRLVEIVKPAGAIAVVEDTLTRMRQLGLIDGD